MVGGFVNDDLEMLVRRVSVELYQEEMVYCSVVGGILENAVIAGNSIILQSAPEE